MTQEIFKQVIGAMMVAFGREISSDAQSLYWSHLKHFSDAEFKRAATTIVKEFRPSAACPFPVLSHFFEAIGDSDEYTATNALTKTKDAVMRIGKYESISFGDMALHATITRFGGWPTVCAWTDKDWQINTPSFLLSYKASAKINNIGNEYLPGIFEANNAGISGYKQKVIVYKDKSALQIEER